MRRWLDRRGLGEDVLRANRVGADPGPALIDFHLDEAQNVYPMMLPGKGLLEMVEGAGE